MSSEGVFRADSIICHWPVSAVRLWLRTAAIQEVVAVLVEAEDCKEHKDEDEEHCNVEKVRQSVNQCLNLLPNT